MRLISTRVLRAGMVLGHTIYNVNEKPLLQAGVTLTEGMITRLRLLKVQYVYIADEKSKGIEVKESVPVFVRQESIREIRDAFSSIHTCKQKNMSEMLANKATKIQHILKNIMSEMDANQDLLMILSDAYIYDSYIFHHSYNVTLYTLAIGKELKLPVKQLEQLGLGAMLHDIGKTMVDESVLMKEGPLTEEEFEEIKQHTVHGFEVLKNLHNVSLLTAHCAFQHHERLNGSGYPRGITGEDIHPYAKIIAVADVFDACTSNRVYRDKMLPADALEILLAGSGTLFDPTVIKAFQMGIAIYPNGLTVQLSDGRKGIVARQNKGVSTRPVIRVIEESHKIVRATYEVDLSSDLNCTIAQTDVAFITE
ncbi:HD-GYP domain-containing protein [Jeotgalibacillus haloalkalitolerans]|uniref:HD-GYP domain-containing protein n=1 Tax=Jeotgalibacillus haloalkalitolerans TaxID=3104292 RepID=A0ABU5KQS5_9BACL|nr:HD-GYP domain-containing protein [Jeotgalibacillus sp. HH7-29]MDZ5713603.1 HD-GYP domain-containing protein [Jeotgalibacillus sp. HH7-29]